MKKFLLLFFFLGNFIYSQNAENIHKIEFNYIYGGSSWGKNGIYSRSEYFEIIKTENGDFKISKQLKINEKVNRDVFSKDSIEINTSNYKLISKKEIENLIESLNTNEDNFKVEFLKENFTKPTKKEISKIAKKYDSKNYFKNNYDDKSDTEKKYSEIINYKYFDEFVEKNKPELDRYILTMDVWNNFSIITYKKQESIIYDFQLFYNCGQPIISSLVEINKKIKQLTISMNQENQ